MDKGYRRYQISVTKGTVAFDHVVNFNDTRRYWIGVFHHTGGQKLHSLVHRAREDDVRAAVLAVAQGLVENFIDDGY